MNKKIIWSLTVLFGTGLVVSNIIYPVIILHNNKIIEDKTDLSSVMTVKNLGKISSNSKPTIQSKIVALNPDVGKFTWSQIEITSITITSAHISAKGDSELYRGGIDVSFTIFTDISTIIMTTNLDPIFDDAAPYVKAAIISANPQAADLIWQQIDITNITENGAHIAAKEGSPLYLGELDVTFVLVLYIETFVTITDLNSLPNNNHATIQQAIINANPGAEELLWDQIEITSITSTSAHVAAKEDSVHYRGYFDVTFAIAINYLADGTNWPGYTGGTLAYNLNETNHTYTITSGSNGYVATNLNIPQFVNIADTIYTVISIGDSAFWSGGSGGNLYGSLTFPNTVTTIAGSAFRSSIKTSSSPGILSLSESLVSIGSSAFNTTHFIGSLVIPNSVTTIGEMAFMNCHDYSSLTLSNNLTGLGTNAFGGNSGCTGTLIIPSSITSIPDLCFNGCSSFTHLVLSNNLISIGVHSFSSGGFIGTLVLPNTLTSIGYGAFYDDSKIDNIFCTYGSAPSLNDWPDSPFNSWQTTGIVQNINPNYSSTDLCTYLKTKGLPAGWAAA